MPGRTTTYLTYPKLLRIRLHSDPLAGNCTPFRAALPRQSTPPDPIFCFAQVQKAVFNGIFPTGRIVSNFSVFYKTIAVRTHHISKTLPDIAVNAYRLPFYILRAGGLPHIYAGIHRVFVLRRHLPERILYDNRGVVSHAQL